MLQVTAAGIFNFLLTNDCLQDAVKVMAKSLVRNRHAVTKMYGLKSQLQAVSLRIQVSILTLALSL